jgi:hypothetical protein
MQLQKIFFHRFTDHLRVGIVAGVIIVVAFGLTIVACDEKFEFTDHPNPCDDTMCERE